MSAHAVDALPSRATLTVRLGDSDYKDRCNGYSRSVKRRSLSTRRIDLVG
jgi:hypothetical protein